MTTAAIPEDNGNGRVTLALVGQKLDTLMQRVESMDRTITAAYKEQEDRLRTVEKDAATMDVTVRANQRAIEGIENEVKEVRKTVNWWNSGNSFAAVIAGIVAALK